MLLKQKPANIRKWIARFYYFGHLYSAGSAYVCCAHNNCMKLPISEQLYLRSPHSSPSGSLQLFSQSDRPLWGWNNPGQRCLPVRGGCIIHAGGGGSFTHWLTDCFDVQPTTTSGSIITQSIISSFSIRLTPSCVLHRAQQHHADASACQ